MGEVAETGIRKKEEVPNLRRYYCTAGVNQQPPLHQLRMSPLRSFSG